MIVLLILALKEYGKSRITFDKNIDINELVRGIRKIQRSFSDYYGISLPIRVVNTMGGILTLLYSSHKLFNKARAPFNKMEVKQTNGGLVI